RLVVGAAVVVAGEPEEAGERQDEQRRRERQPSRPPPPLRAEPGVGGVAEQLRRVERRQVGAEGVVRVLERRPRGVDHERREDDERDERRGPPGVTAGGAAVAASGERCCGARTRTRRHALSQLRRSWTRIYSGVGDRCDLATPKRRRQ